MTPAVVIMGPTATGKSALAIELAKAQNGEIISMDSALVYQGMDVGTAKPSLEERAGIPHHLIDICAPSESYSAAAFRSDCLRLIGQIQLRGHLPIICGGTMLYYKALTQGLSPLPATDPNVRARVQEEGERLGWPALHQRLKDIDPPLFAKYAPNDKQRIARALEVYYQTGRAVTSFYAEQGERCPYPLAEFVLLPPDDRAALRVQIRRRLEHMVEHGLLEEAQMLLNLHLPATAPALRCVGYRQALEYLKGEVDYPTFMEKAVAATAQLAKHQMTWLRGALKDPSRIRLSPGDAQNLQIILERLGSCRPSQNSKISADFFAKI